MTDWTLHNGKVQYSRLTSHLLQDATMAEAAALIIDRADLGYGVQSPKRRVDLCTIRLRADWSRQWAGLSL